MINAFRGKEPTENVVLSRGAPESVNGRSFCVCAHLLTASIYSR